MPAKLPSTRSSTRKTKLVPWDTPAPCPLRGCRHFAPDLNQLVAHLMSEAHRPAPQRRVRKDDLEETQKQRKEVCLMCGFRTKTFYDLRAHYNAEVGALPFECGVSFQVVNPDDPSSAVLVECPYRTANNPNMHNHRANWHGIHSIYHVPSKQADKENSKKLRRKPTPSKSSPYARPETSQEKQRTRRAHQKDAFWTKEAIFDKLQWFTNFPSEREKFEDELDRALEEQELISIPSDAVVYELEVRRSSASSSSSRETRRQASSSASSSSSSSSSTSPSVYLESSSSSSSSSASPDLLWDFSQFDVKHEDDDDLDSIPLLPAPAHIPAVYTNLPQNVPYIYNNPMPLSWASGSVYNMVAPADEYPATQDTVSLAYQEVYSSQVIDPSLKHALEAPLDFQSFDLEEQNQELYGFAPEEVEFAPPPMYPHHMAHYYPELGPVMYEPVLYPHDFLLQQY